MGTGSGVIVGAEENGTYILTAGHICDRPAFAIITAFDIDMNKFETSTVKISTVSDLCLLKTLKRMPRPEVVIATGMPVPGSKVYNLSAPLGIHSYRMILQFEGFYSGRILNPRGYYLDIHTIPTKPGSSGSPTFNDRWEMIGITSMAYERVENIGMMVTLEDIRCFLGSSVGFKCPTEAATNPGAADKLMPL